MVLVYIYIYIGLRLKSSFENIFGHVYPKMSDDEDWRNKKRKDGKLWNKGNKLYSDRQKEAAKRSRRIQYQTAETSVEKPSTSNKETQQSTDSPEDIEFNFELKIKLKIPIFKILIYIFKYGRGHSRKQYK